MGIVSFIRKKFSKKGELKPLSVERPGLKMRLMKGRRKRYVGTVALIYKDKPIRQFTVHEEGFSRDKVAADLDQKLTVKLISVKQDKSKRNNAKK